MNKHEIFAQFFTNLLKMENRQQARDLAFQVWPATHSMWLHPMEIDDVLIELGLAQKMDDGRIGYLAPQDSSLPWKQVNWEIERPTLEEKVRLGQTAEQMFAPQERTVVLQDGRTVSWTMLKSLAAQSHVWFQIPKGENDISFRMGPDHFPDSYVLAWLTLEEKKGGADAYQDNRVRSSEPDDFLSRIHHLTSGSDESFVPNE